MYRNGNWDEGPEGIIKRNLIVGNIEGAIECAMKAGRHAEALLLASSSKDLDLFEKTQQLFFEQNNDPFVTTVIKGIVEEDIDELIFQMAKKSWKEAVLFALSYIPKERI